MNKKLKILSAFLLCGVLASPIISNAEMMPKSNLNAKSYVNISSSYATVSMDTSGSFEQVPAESNIYINNVLYRNNYSAIGKSSVSCAANPNTTTGRNGAYYRNSWIYSYKTETLR